MVLYVIIYYIIMSNEALASPVYSSGNVLAVGSSVLQRDMLDVIQSVNNENVILSTGVAGGPVSGLRNTVVGALSGTHLSAGNNNVLLGYNVSGGTAANYGGNLLIGNNISIGSQCANNVLLSAAASYTSGGTFANIFRVNMGTAEGGHFDNSFAQGSGQASLTFDAESKAVTYTPIVPSSVAFKENIKELNADEKVKMLNVVNTVDVVKYDYKDSAPEPFNGQKDNFGMIAQEIEKVFPAACKYTTNADGVKTLYTIEYDKLVIPMWVMLKDLNARLTALESK